jgi:hypothetical protein
MAAELTGGSKQMFHVKTATLRRELMCPVALRQFVSLTYEHPYEQEACVLAAHFMARIRAGNVSLTSQIRGKAWVTGRGYDPAIAHNLSLGCLPFGWPHFLSSCAKSLGRPY